MCGNKSNTIILPICWTKSLVVLILCSTEKKALLKINLYQSKDLVPKEKKGHLSVAFVIPLGLEPRTHTLKVYCSTN